MESVTNLVPETRFVCRLAGVASAHNLSAAEFSALSLSSLCPVAPIPAWIGKRSHEGLWWLSLTGKHVTFASTWERDVLTLLDYQGALLETVRDPVLVIPARGDDSTLLRPWLLVRHADGSRVLLVHPADERRSRALVGAIRELGIDVAIPVLPANEDLQVLRWLAGYRFTRFRLPDEAERLDRDVCAVERSLSWTIRDAAQTTGYDEQRIRANVFSQLWRRTIALTGSGRRLSDSSVVRAS